MSASLASAFKVFVLMAKFVYYQKHDMSFMKRASLLINLMFYGINSFIESYFADYVRKPMSFCQLDNFCSNLNKPPGVFENSFAVEKGIAVLW